MENEYDNNGEWLKRKLQDAEPVWSEGAWNDFENRRSNKRRRILWIYFTFTLLALGIGSSLLYNYFHTNDTAIFAIKNLTPAVKETDIVKNDPDSYRDLDKPIKNSSNENLGNITNPLPTTSNNSVNHTATLYKTPTIKFINNDISIDTAADYQPPQIDVLVTDSDIPNTNPVKENTIAEKENSNIDIPATDPKIVETPTIVQPPVTKPIELPKADKPKAKNDKPSKPYIKKTYIGLEYNPSQIIFANDISIASSKYVNASLSKNAEMTYNNLGGSVGRFVNKNISMQTGINIYSYSTKLNYTEQITNTQLVASPYTSFRMDTAMRRINKRVDTIYSTVTTTKNQSGQTQIRLQYISIPLNVLYQLKYKTTQIGVGGGIVVHHLQNTPASNDYSDNIKISPWKMNANIQFDAGWKLYKSVSIYTGYNFGYGVSNKTNYIQHGLRTGLRILL